MLQDQETAPSSPPSPKHKLAEASRYGVFPAGAMALSLDWERGLHHHQQQQHVKHACGEGEDVSKTSGARSEGWLDEGNEGYQDSTGTHGQEGGRLAVSSSSGSLCVLQVGKDMPFMVLAHELSVCVNP
jgi:hypothetical protein